MTKKFQIFMAGATAVFLVLVLVFGILLLRTVEALQLSSDSVVNLNEDYLAQRIAEEFAAAQGKLLISTAEEIQSIDTDSFQVKHKVTAVPKEYKQGAAAQLTAAGKTVPMQWNNGELSAEIMLPFDAQVNDYRVTITSGGVAANEVVQGELTLYLNDADTLFGAGDISWYQTEKGLYVEFPLVLSEELLPFGDKAQSIRIFAEQNGKAAFDKPMKGSEFHASHTFAKDGVVVVYAELTGESGLTYLYTLQEIFPEIDDDVITIQHEDYENIDRSIVRITGKDGKTMEAHTY